MEEEPSFEELLEQLNHDDWKVRKQEIDKIRKFKDVDSYFARENYLMMKTKMLEEVHRRFS